MTTRSTRQAGLYAHRSRGARGEEKEEEKAEEKFENPHADADADADTGATHGEEEQQPHGASTGGGGDSGSEDDSDTEEEEEEEEVRKIIKKTYEEESESESESEEDPEQATGTATGTANGTANGEFVDMGGGIGVFNPEDSQEWEEGEEQQAPPLDNSANQGHDQVAAGINNQDDDAVAANPLETINPEDPNYKEPPRRPDEKGKLQLYMEDSTNLPTKVTYHMFLMTVASSVLQVSLIDMVPYSSHQAISPLKKSRGVWKSMKPTKQSIVLEIKRRNPQFAKNQKNKPVEFFWNELSSAHNALSDEDVRYIKLQERVHRQMTEALLSSVTESAPQKQERQVRSDRMRFICCFQDDRIVEAYKLSQISMTRTELDGRNSASRNSNFYDLVVAKFNDTDWVAKSKAIPTLNRDFVEEHEFPKRSDFTLDTHKAKNILSWERSEIMTVLRKYQASGRGSTNVAEKYQLGDMTDDEIHVKWGHFDSELAETEGGDDRQDYLGGKPTDILYWWAILDELDIIQATCVVFKKIYGASSMEPPIPIAQLESHAKSSRKAKANEASKALAKELYNIGSELASMNEYRRQTGVKRTKAKLEERLEDLRDKRFQLQEKLYTQTDGKPEEYKDTLKDRIAGLEEQITALEESIEEEDEHLSQMRQKRLKKTD